MQITINIDCPSWMKRVGKLALPALIIATAGIALGGPVVNFTTGETLKAADLNANFTGLDMRLGALESGAGTHSAEATAGATTAGAGNWTDIPGLQVTFTTTGSGTVELFSVVSMTASGGASECAIRFVLDASPVGGAAGLEAIGDVNPPFTTTPGIIQLTGLRQVPITAGPHTASVQFEKSVGVFAGSNCVVGGTTFNPNARLRAVVNAP